MKIIELVFKDNSSSFEKLLPKDMLCPQMKIQTFALRHFEIKNGQSTGLINENFLFRTISFAFSFAFKCVSSVKLCPNSLNYFCFNRVETGSKIYEVFFIVTLFRVGFLTLSLP